MAALYNNFIINSPSFQNSADELANRAYQKARATGLSHVDALYAMTQGPMGVNRDLLSVTGSPDMRGYIGATIRDARLKYSAERLLPPPAQAAPALSNDISHLTGAKMGSAPPPALQAAPAELAQSPAGPQPRPALEHPKPHMQSAISNDPLLQLMAGGNKQRVGPNETLAFFQNLHPDARKQHAARIDGSHLASLEARDENAAKQATEIVTLGAGNQVVSGDPVDLQQELYAAQNNANPDRSYRDMSQGAQDARGALASVNTSTSGELPVLAAGPDRSGSNSLTNLLSGLSRDGIDFAKAVIENGISVTFNGNEIFATDGQGNTAQVDEKTAAAIQAANSGDGEQQQQNGPYFPEMPVAPPALTDPTAPVTAGNNNGALTVKDSQNTQPAANRVRASTGGYTGNARGSGLPDMQIGLGERMMRMGMAGLANASQGSLAQMGAMTGAYNDVNQANRDAEMGTFKIEEARRQAHADRVAKLAAAKAKGAGDLSKIKDHQGKSFGFYNRGVDAERVLSRLDEQGTEFWKTVGSKVPIFGNKFVGSEYRQYDQARRNFLNAVLRRESGAVISEKEFEEGNQQYFPQFGDEETEIAQKRENRRTTMLGIRISAGDAMQYTSNYPSSGTVKVGTATVTLLP